jgi:hypothetical protein
MKYKVLLKINLPNLIEELFTIQVKMNRGVSGAALGNLEKK